MRKALATRPEAPAPRARSSSSASLLLFKVYGGDVLADDAAEVRDGDVLGVDCVGFEARAVFEGHDEAGVVGARELEHVEADCEALNLWDDCGQASQHGDVLAPLLLAHVRFVLPDYDVRQHSLLVPVSE